MGIQIRIGLIGIKYNKQKKICINRTHLYHTLRKTPIKKERKGPFLIKKKIRLQIKQGKSIHKKKLKPPPKYNYRTGDHSIREWFLKAKKSYLESHIRIKSWSTVKKSTLAKKIKILDYKWVYIYKFNKYSRFIKYKIQLMVRKN